LSEFETQTRSDVNVQNERINPLFPLRQNGVGTGFIGANAILPKGHCHSELFFEHCDPVNIAVWSAETVGDSESFAVRRERIFAADVELFGFPFDR
jgi:hypothetical protein